MESGSRVVRAPRVRLGPGAVRSALPGRWRTQDLPNIFIGIQCFCQATLNETLGARGVQ